MNVKNPYDLITVEMFWRDTIPAVAPPPHKIIYDWFRWYTLDQIFAAIETERNATDYADRIGRRVSTTLRRRHGTALAPMADTTRAVHFDENGIRCTVT